MILMKYKEHFIVYFLDPDGEWISHVPFADLHERIQFWHYKKWLKQIIKDNKEQIENAKKAIDE